MRSAFSSTKSRPRKKSAAAVTHASCGSTSARVTPPNARFSNGWTCQLPRRPQQKPPLQPGKPKRPKPRPRPEGRISKDYAPVLVSGTGDSFLVLSLGGSADLL